MRNACGIWVALLGSVACGNVHGAVVVYSNRAAFIAAAGAVLTEGYESYPTDVQAGARTIALNSLNINYSLNGDVSWAGVADVIDFANGVGPTAGLKYFVAVYPSSTVPSAATTFQFASPVTAFGTDIKDLENSPLTFTTSAGDSGTAANPSADGAVQFFGIISDQPFAFISLAAAGSSGGDTVIFDQTTFSVPTGACCNRWTGNCTIRSQADCLAQGLRFQGAGVSCLPTNCLACPADFNGSGGVSVQDIFDFLASFFAGCP